MTRTENFEAIRANASWFAFGAEPFLVKMP